MRLTVCLRYEHLCVFGKCDFHALKCKRKGWFFFSVETRLVILLVGGLVDDHLPTSMFAGSRLGKFSKGECRDINTECLVLASRLLQTLPRALIGFLTCVPFSVTVLKQVEISLVSVSPTSFSDNSNSRSQLEDKKEL